MSENESQLRIVDLEELMNNLTDTEEPKEEPNESEYLQLANDCKNRIAQKNQIIAEMQKKFIMIYTFITRYMETDDTPFIEEAKLLIDEALVNFLNIQSKD